MDYNTTNVLQIMRTSKKVFVFLDFSDSLFLEKFLEALNFYMQKFWKICSAVVIDGE